MLRKRKNRRYNETNDEEGDGERKFDIIAQIKSERFDQIKEKYLQELSGEDITLRYVQKNGFDRPILVKSPQGLGLRVPPKSFIVRDVRNYVGHQRIIDVMDVKTQKNIEMSMKDWCKYYESKSRDRLLNVISLEFSHTKLDELVESPMIVKLLDWVDLVWPKFLKESQIESTNTINKMKYPKVQKYCLMSVKGSYTDFHIDFGGTSVWYHILRGRKIFWMVPPTELNLQIFEEWTLSGMQQDVFFGDTVEECFRVELIAGNTFFIPSGWIHAVYTIEDSLVFGGNFLHSFGIENQLKVSKIEDATKVPVKFRYPFYTEILWYVVQHYVYSLTEKDHLHKPDISVSAPSKAGNPPEEKKNTERQNKTSIEIEDETTESEQEESDNKKKKFDNVKKRKLRQRTPKKSAPSKETKKTPPPTDDESTEIDSEIEEAVKPVKRPPTNTCRMTKNSLLRLQYEVEEQQLLAACKASIKSESPSSDSRTKKEAESFLTQVTNNQQPVSTSSTTLNLAEIVLSQESKLNGWPTSGGQSVWSNPKMDSKESNRIHITKFELNGLKVLVKHLSKLSGAKKNLPNLIRNSRALLDDCRKLIVEHENDDPELAITGKPITPELLNEKKKTDINELIGQFFKPTDATCSSQSSNTTTSSLTNNNSSSNLSASKSKIDTASPTQQQRLKSNHSDGASKGETSTSAPSSHLMHNDSSVSSKSLSPHKETKCLSPIKKSSNSVNTPASNSSPPPRPKSPPTRPLSNNQYTSKTKNNNNLLLPGSFADLIAATSTEKKVFDVGGSNATSSLFGIKDLSPTKSSSLHSICKSKAEEKSICSSSGKCLSFKLSGINKTPTTVANLIDTISPASTSTSAGAGVNSSKDQQLPSKQPNSPEPPKAIAQKRFITPSSFRPYSKEKLIYASAPYISPAHVTDQSRSVNAPHPWQTPNQQSASTSASTSSTSNYSPLTPRQQPPHSVVVTPTPTVASSSTPSNIQAPTYTTADSRTASHSTQNADKAAKARVNQHKHDVVSTKHNSVAEVGRVSDYSTSNDNYRINKNSNHEPSGTIASSSLKPSEAASCNAIAKQNSFSNQTTSMGNTQSALHKDTLKDEDSADKATAIKKVNKPRGPPKKSKEARQVAELSNTNIKLAESTSVIKAPTSSATKHVVIPASNPTQPTTSMLASSQVVPKAKPKRSKKQKDSEQPQIAPTGNILSAQRSVVTTQIRPQQAQRSVICSLVTPPTSAPGAKAAPQSYLIPRPLLFNTMPAFSAAQFQQSTRGPLPLLATSMGSPLGLPLQHGARIVWATQPQRLTSTQATNVTASSQAPTSNLASGLSNIDRHGVTSQSPARPTTITTPDNAALLSLATTVLSTAPLVGSPTLGQLNNRATTPQAIMVSSASNQPALFSPGQQFFRPFIQRLPMTRFVPHPSVSGAPGASQSGQLVFARLPNQNQPRYLITQPGFMQHRFQAPHVGVNHPTSSIAFATIKPPTTDASKNMKSKKVKTN